MPASTAKPARVALVTGASRGLGVALTATLVRDGWRVIVDARDGSRLHTAVDDMHADDQVVAVPGDVADPRHRLQLVAAVADAGGLDVLVNNASVLGPSPRPSLAAYPLAALERVYAVNTVAPLALFQLTLPHLRPAACVINVSSDAALEPYEGWGGYGSSKAALDQISAILGAENPKLRVYAFDPGDMATDLHRQAFPGEDISDRPAPESVVPSLVRLICGSLPSGRYRITDLASTGS
ncbi:MAG: SDR family oxidoreductase [Candidatus Dormibacteraeota bacterium]|uniref:SDR family oxidoreductase n=1 Tax=Candidatus Amunia macphersoniae TaxID=3127014 RepID=A0A934KBN4_9BACT|nr:SDR family oxidoreductase [Candidatus Dormibacteraeota bacterium]